MNAIANPTAQQALDLTGRKKYVDDSVVATIPDAIGTELVFFKIGRYVSEEELETEYLTRGLKPASPVDICLYDMNNKAEMDSMKYVATHWKDMNNLWCWAGFRSWSGGRSVDVYRSAGEWADGWWFAGCRILGTSSLNPSARPSDTLTLGLPSERMRALFEASKKRYEEMDIDTSQMAALSNVLMSEVGKILDEQENRIGDLEGDHASVKSSR